MHMMNISQFLISQLWLIYHITCPHSLISSKSDRRRQQECGGCCKVARSTAFSGGAFVLWSHWHDEVLSLQTSTGTLRSVTEDNSTVQTPVVFPRWTSSSTNSSDILSTVFQSFPSMFFSIDLFHEHTMVNRKIGKWLNHFTIFPSFRGSLRRVLRPCGVLQGDPQVAPLLSLRLQELLPKAGSCRFSGPSGPQELDGSGKIR